MQLEKIPVDVRALGRSVAAVFQGELEKRGIALVVEVPAHDSWLMLDPTRLRQVLMNLLGNARKFTERGSIRLALQVQDAPAGTWLHAAVTDTGCGIPAALQGHLFDPYTQADGSISRQYGGTGLGLSISHDLVKLMGGRIDLHSVEGEGTTVSLRIPAERTDAAAAPAVATPGGVLRGVRVLVVDDHAPNRMVLEEQLARLGAVAMLADSAAQALATLTADLPHIVLLDCFMPDIDGYQASRMIRTAGIPGVADLPIIAISAASDAAHLARCQQAGMNGVLKKPIRLAELQGMLALWTGRTAAAGSADRAGQTAALEAIERVTVDRLEPDLRVLLADDLHKLRDAVDASDLARIIFYAHRLHGPPGWSGGQRWPRWPPGWKPIRKWIRTRRWTKSTRNWQACRGRGRSGYDPGGSFGGILDDWSNRVYSGSHERRPRHRQRPRKDPGHWPADHGRQRLFGGRTE